MSTEPAIRQALTEKSWDLIICDYFLQGYDAPRVMVLLEHLGIDIPFILVSGYVSQEVADVALRMGAHEYLEKSKLGRLGPIIHRELKLFNAYDENLKAWGRMMEIRDFETKGHTDRVVDLSVRLAVKMGVSVPEIVHIRRGAYLHDIGKLAIPDAILLKKGKLTDEELVVMKGHPVIGYELVRNQEFLKRALEIPLLHHEKWNGTGYPYGLQGEAIPLPARIFAVVDVYDASITPSGRI